jgi:hypothetical protein
MERDFARADATWLGFVEHARTFDGMDSPILRSLENNGGKLSSESVRQIATDYWVARNFPATVIDRYSKIADVVNDGAADWPEAMSDRVDRCCTMIDAIKEKVGTKNRTVSAVTKFVWFVRPKHWLPFDRHAANGLISGGAALPRMRRYFEHLDRSAFPTVCDRMNEILSDAGYSGLSGERIIDKALMVRGLRRKPSNLLTGIIASNTAYLNRLPADERARMTGTASRLAADFPDTGIAADYGRGNRARVA